MDYFSLEILEGGQILDWGSEQQEMSNSSLNQLFAISTYISTYSLEITLNLTRINSEQMVIVYDITT